jgi:hypothetical protein
VGADQAFLLRRLIVKLTTRNIRPCRVAVSPKRNEPIKLVSVTTPKSDKKKIAETSLDPNPPIEAGITAARKIPAQVAAI